MNQTCSIERIELYEIRIPFKIPFTISGGTSHYRKSLIVKLMDSDGCVGFGESAPFEHRFIRQRPLKRHG